MLAGEKIIGGYEAVKYRNAACPKWDDGMNCDMDSDDMEMDTDMCGMNMDCGCPPKMMCKKECVKTFTCQYRLYRICMYRLHKVCPRCGREFDYHGCRGMCPHCR